MCQSGIFGMAKGRVREPEEINTIKWQHSQLISIICNKLLHVETISEGLKLFRGSKKKDDHPNP